MSSNLQARTLTGIAFLFVLVGALVCSPISFVIVFCAISMLATQEFCHLINRYGHAHVSPLPCIAGALYLFLACAYYCIYPDKTGIFIPYLLLLIYVIVSELYRKKENPIADIAYSMMSQCYIALPFALLNLLAFSTNPDSSIPQYSHMITLAIFIFIWTNDTGAYCIGSLIGKHRLFERISPKKSWEGSIGGAVISIAAACLLHYVWYPEWSLCKWMGLAVTVIVFGTWGDLAESQIKRTLGIKDSGHILPGHGGFLDRFDSALLAIPAALLYVYFIQ